ncbi:MAG: NAD(P)H-hydrate dehydratase [Candidatus Omnitrophica bacterium]|jgi:NAD(P)H-hydrate epimerase|nr:NAD(P)H-hydrate dehydratase [Candidatus Omnitrophota bacterium]
MQLPTRLLQRKLNSHKADFGHVLILAGSLKFSGAALLAGEACLRSGAGLVTLGMPKSLCLAVLKIKAKEIMLLPLAETKDKTLDISAFKEIKDFMKKAQVLAIGPGLSDDKSTQSLARKVISEISKPMVIDADGLNALAGHLSILLKRKGIGLPTILTPHPGEMSRLSGISAAKVQAARKKVAKELANDYNCVIVLKGHRTVVAGPKVKTYENTTGNPGMASAGSGDVLTGMIAAFLGQNLNAFEATKYAVYLHGLAGDLAGKEKTQISLIASDIIAKIPAAIRKCS